MNVLILTDFSEVSRNTGKYAADFFQKTAANFYLLNIHAFNFNRSEENNLGKKLVLTLDQLQKDAAHLSNYSGNPNHKFETILSSENLISAVRKVLLEKKIDLIFIGTASQNERSHPILGDHAYNVVKKIKCNIIAVPGGCSYHELKKAVFPVDRNIFSTAEQDRVFDSLNFLTTAHFEILEIKNRNVEYLEKEKNTLSVKTPVAFTRKLFKEIQKQFDVIFILGKNLNICDRLLHSRHGFTAKMNIEIPIFVYHN